MTKQFSKQKIKRINRITWIVSAIIAISFVVLFNIINTQEDSLLKSGIREQVVVVKKYKTGTRKNPHYYMDVDWFEVIEKIPYYKRKDTTGLDNAEKMSDDILSTVFKDKERTKIERLGKTIKLSYINGDSYNNTSIGEIVTLVYFKDNLRDGRLLREIE
ncbi:hypothetical protein [Flavivirga spongiicola]|uniref:Uncharacterized protein n=1 Tax=Flavivirga spongiicola TaxID=421621 RepID=A0ABU7XMN5_9FLAO|nr:hypothetical protein [Flavivirga sp. MEBiC05379]MDO5981362.1 hypothetical protein [Flavivirga sp. MEBiC05379]